MKKFYLKLFLFLSFSSIIHSLSAQRYVEMMQDENVNFYDVQKEANKYFAANGTEKGSGYKTYKRWEYENSLLIDEYGKRITESTQDANYRKALAYSRKSNSRTSATPITNWTEFGPQKITPTSGWNPGVGRIKAIAGSTSNSSLLYAGPETGGVWKSTTGGTSWAPTMVSESNQNIRSIAVDQTNNNIVYAGSTGGIYKSTNGATSWSLLTGVSSTVYKIIINPTNSQIIILATSGGVYKSIDAGATWVKKSTSSVEDIEFKPGDPSILYAVGSSYYLRSSDEGETFSAISSITGTGRSMVTVSAANPAIVYILQASGSMYGNFYKSTDSGLTFTIVNTGSSGTNNLFGYNTDGTGTSGQAYHDMALAASPTNANEIHLGAIICFKSTDGGTTWTATTNWTWGNTTGYNHADVHVMEFIGNTIYSGSDGGIYKSTNNGGDWTDLTSGMGIRQFYRFGLCRANPDVMSGGAQDNGTSVHRADGIWYDWLGGDGMESFVDHTNTSILYGTSQNGSLYKSTNGGNTRSSITGPSGDAAGNWVTPFCMDPQVNTTIYAGFIQVYKSINSGSSWTAISTFTGSSKCDEIEIAGSNSNYIIARYGNTVYATTNGGTNWSTLTMPSGTINTIAIHPTKPSTITVGTSAGKVYTSTDFGTTFTQVTGASLPAISILKITYDDGSKDGFYIGLTKGVYFRDNTMTDFVAFTANLPIIQVYDMEYHVASKKIFIATYGRGVWWSAAYNSGPVNVSPTVSITSPLNNASFTDPSSITINATATDSDGSISKVEFYVDNTLVGTSTTSPYTTNWTTNLTAGTHVLTAKAYDNLNTITTSAVVNIVIQLTPNNPPVVTITSPANNASFTDATSVVINATATDSDGSITKVEFYIDNVLKSTSTTSPYKYTWNAGLTLGNHQLTAKAYDNKNAVTTSSITTITLKSSTNTIPVISMNQPTNNQLFNEPAAVTLGATATDVDGTISKVEFYVNGVLKGSSTISPYTFALSNVMAGTYKVNAVATDNGTAKGYSDTVTFIVKKQIGGCSAPAWNSATVYLGDGGLGTGNGEVVSYNGKQYRAQWWTQNNLPTAGGPWLDLGTCVSYTQLPYVVITSPLNNASFTAPASVTIKATATDADGTISKVEFYQGTTKLGQSTTSPYTFTWTNVAQGTYKLTAVATDNMGAIDTSTVVTINVSAVTSVNDIQYRDGRLIYPNPVSDILYIPSPEMLNKVYSLEIINAQGATIIKDEVNLFNTYELHVNHLTSGIYILKLKSGPGVQTFKFEVKH